MIISLGILAAHRNFDPVKFSEFAKSPQGSKLVEKCGKHVSNDKVEELVAAYRADVGEAQLALDRVNIQRALRDC